MNHSCDCQSSERRLAVYADGPPEDHLDLWGAAEKLGAAYNAENGVAVFRLGADCRFGSVADLVDFLRGLEPDRFARLSGEWLASNADRLPARPGHTTRLAEMAPRGHSPLAEQLERRELETWFQPILRADALSLWGYECLMRTRLEDGTVVPPEEVIGWARQEHLLFMLDRICRETHVANAARLRAPPGTVFFINFLPTVIYDPEVCLRTTIQAAEEAGLAPEQLVFEVVETDRIPDRAHLRHVLDHYRENGFRVALDDLGTGHSGLVLLGELDPDIIKIDRELIVRAPASELHRTICRSVVEIGHGSGKQVLAEGVETEAEWDVMQQLGVDLVQGFRFGRPEPLLAD